MKCSYCGYENKETSRFCENCGAELIRTDLPDAAPAESREDSIRPEENTISGSYNSNENSYAQADPGAGIPVPPNGAPQAPYMNQMPPKKKNSKIGIAVLILGFLGMGSAVFGLIAIGLGIFDLVKNKDKKHLLTIIGLVLACLGIVFSGASNKSSKSDEFAKTESVAEPAAEKPEKKTESKAESAENSSAQEKQEEKAATEEKTESETKPEAEPAAAEAEANVQSIYHVGDTLEDGNTRIVYAASGEYTEENEFIQPQEGYHYIFLKFAFENISDKSDAHVTIYGFECYADGYSCQAHYGQGDNMSSTLSAGRSTMGTIYFEVPDGAQDIQIEYTPNMFLDKKIVFAYEGDLDSGYQLEKKSEASENAVNPGESVESKAMRINYISCERDTTYSEFTPPKDGYHFVTCTFEFENLSTSDESITFYSFDCYADGAVCDAGYFRDDAISATLSAGRKAVGTVTFEVPDDAAVVEVEYLTNFWTSNRVVFNALV